MIFFKYLFWLILSIAVAFFLFFVYNWIKKQIFYIKAIILLKKASRKASNEAGKKLLNEIIEGFEDLNQIQVFEWEFYDL